MVCQYLRILLHKLTRYISTYNVYKAISPTNDPYKLQTQVISTYVFIVSLLLSISIVSVYISTVTITKTLTIDNPTLEQYYELHKKYEKLLTCPCRIVASEYGSFLHVNYTLHQICSSSFVTNDWINYINKFDDLSQAPKDEFRKFGSFIFRALTSLCKEVDNTIRYSRSRFYAEQYISIALTPHSIFQSRAESFVNQFRSSTINDFVSSLSVVRDINQANFYYSSLETNARYYVLPGSGYYWPQTQNYSNCLCNRNSSCKSPAIIYEKLSTRALFTVPGIYFGCYILEALLESNLQCFYNQSCFEELISFMDMKTHFNGTIMNASLKSQFSPNTPIKKILENLMIENLTLSTIYERYFNNCHPKQCAYMEKTRNDVIYIVTTVTGLIGGLVTVLKWIAPVLVRLFRGRKANARRENGNVHVTIALAGRN